MQREFDAMVSDPCVVTWRLREHMVCVWEVEMKALLAAVPESLEPVEIRPDVGLVSAACQRYRAVKTTVPAACQYTTKDVVQ